MGRGGPWTCVRHAQVFFTGAHVILVSSIKLGWMDFPVFFQVLSYLEATKIRAGHLWIRSLVCLQLSKPSQRLLIHLPGGRPITPTHPSTQSAFLSAYSLASSSVCWSVSSLIETISRSVQSWFSCCWPRDPFHSLCMWPSLVEIHPCDVLKWLSVGSGAPASGLGQALLSCPVATVQFGQNSLDFCLISLRQDLLTYTEVLWRLIKCWFCALGKKDKGLD